MNTVERGDTFEKEVFKYFQEELSKNRLFVPKQWSKLFSKKGYYSKDRKNDIITDISIETYLPKATDYSLLTVIECKDYNSTIPVNDVEEFYSKVQQIAGVNVKAIFVTKSELQKSALEFAKSKKMGVIYFIPKEQIYKGATTILTRYTVQHICHCTLGVSLNNRFGEKLHSTKLIETILQTTVCKIVPHSYAYGSNRIKGKLEKSAGAVLRTEHRKSR